MNTGAINTTTNVTPFTQNLRQQQQQKQQTAKEAIAANVQALIEQLEQGHSEGLTAYLTAMGRFHNYSFGNILEIARQRPDAQRVAGLYAWNQLGRKVKKGEHGTLLRFVWASCSSICASSNPCSLRIVEASPRNPCPVMRSR